MEIRLKRWFMAALTKRRKIVHSLENVHLFVFYNKIKDVFFFICEEHVNGVLQLVIAKMVSHHYCVAHSDVTISAIFTWKYIQVNKWKLLQFSIFGTMRMDSGNGWAWKKNTHKRKRKKERETSCKYINCFKPSWNFPTESKPTRKLHFQCIFRKSNELWTLYSQHDC